MTELANEIESARARTLGFLLAFGRQDGAVRISGSLPYAVASSGPFESSHRIKIHVTEAALEMLEQAPDGLDVVVVPVGGGSLAAGTVTVLKALSPATRSLRPDGGVEDAA